MKKDEPSFESEFKELTGISWPPREINAPSARRLRADKVFEQMARLCFTRPDVGRKIRRRLTRWLSERQDEGVVALAGYVRYCLKDYKGAEKLFLKAVALRPENLDNWLDLAMTFRHLDDPLGLDILFAHNEFIALYSPEPRALTRTALRRLRDRVKARGG